MVPPFENAKLVNITPISLWFIGDISIVNVGRHLNPTDAFNGGMRWHASLSANLANITPTTVGFMVY